ncbi:dof zinc finger protein DOF5.4-like [Abeliophyllum distichum]|uniref:Dof zinc finger protein DOF5.4-like n=1 Tax=Abeliophyllum distichum TaxID=126358 RepID=A0ABD1QYI8_9LAMI
MDGGDFWNMDDNVKTMHWFSFAQPSAERNPSQFLWQGGLGKPLLPVDQPTDDQIFTDIESFTSLISSSEDLENVLGFNMVGVSTSLDRLQQSEQASITENPSPAIIVPYFTSGYFDQTVHQFEFTEENRMSNGELVAVNNQEK